jgi:hypothetical protein
LDFLLSSFYLSLLIWCSFIPTIFGVVPSLFVSLGVFVRCLRKQRRAQASA